MSEHAVSSPDMIGERDPVAEDFIGKTIVRFDFRACNVWRFEFSDGSKIAIESDLFHGLAIMQICVPCGEELNEEKEEKTD